MAAMGPRSHNSAIADPRHALARLLLFHLFPARLEDGALCAALLPQGTPRRAAATPPRQSPPVVDLTAASSEWEEHATPDGFLYYHNVRSREGESAGGHLPPPHPCLNRCPPLLCPHPPLRV